MKKEILTFWTSLVKEVSCQLAPILLIGFPVYKHLIGATFLVGDYIWFFFSSLLLCISIVVLALLADWLHQKNFKWVIETNQVVIRNGGTEVERIAFCEVTKWSIAKAGLILRTKRKRYRYAYAPRHEFEAIIKHLESWGNGVSVQLLDKQVP